MDAHNGGVEGQYWICEESTIDQSQVIANSNCLDEEQDQDPHNSDTEPQYGKKNT